MNIGSCRRRKKLSKANDRIVRIAAFMAFAALLAVIPSGPILALAQPDTATNDRAANTEERTKTFVVEDNSILGRIPGVDPTLTNSRRSDRDPFEITLVQDEVLEGPFSPDFAKGTVQDEGNNPSPMGDIDPEPMDTPFLPTEVLVYNDAVNSEKNPSIAKAANGDLYVAYDHDIGTGLRDTYVSKSTDGGLTWAKRDIAVDAAEDESCPSIAIDYSPMYGGELMYTFYSTSVLEFSWSADGDTWSTTNLGVNIWSTLRCPYVAVRGDFIVVAGTFLNPISLIDTYYVFYTLDNFQTPPLGYFFNPPFADAWVSQVSVTMIDSDEVLIVFDIYDKSDPNPANWWHYTMMAHGILTGDFLADDWTYWQWSTGIANQDYTSPTAEAYGKRVTLVTEVYNPSVLPFSTSRLYCAYTLDITVASPTWFGCDNGISYIAFDVADVKDQKHPFLHQDGGVLHLVWLNETDVYYKFSPDGGLNWIAPPLKTNDLSSSTAFVAWHSPVVTSRNGKAFIAWHDSRGSDNIYFQTFANSRWFELRTDPNVPDLETREVGDSWHKSSYYYLWAEGSGHDVEAQGSYEIPMNTLYTFNQWDDGSLLNPTTVTVTSSYYSITAIYDTSYWLDVISTGVTTPVTGYQPAGSSVTIEAFPPVAPPGARYDWVGWLGVGSGSYTGPSNPCSNCVLMIEPITQSAVWQLQWNVTIDTVPANLAIEIDGVSYIAPHIAWFNDSQTYNLNAPSPQSGGPSTRYMWSHWSDAGLQSHNIVVTAPWTNFTAYFTTEYWLTVDTNIPGLDVTVDGIDHAAPYSYWCPQWFHPWLDAISPQYLGGLGERYVWANWSDGGNQVHEQNCTGAATITAYYILQRSVNITTNPPGFDVIVDGQTYTTPKQFWWNDSSPHVLEALWFINVGPDARYNFTGWSDFGARIHQVTTDTSDLTITANYGSLQHKITLQANEPGITIELDGFPIMLPYVLWCDDGTSHIVNARDPQMFGDTRYIFNSWSDAGAQIHSIPCSAPSVIQVDFDKEYRVYINTTLDGVGSNLDVIVGVFIYPTPAEVWWPADTMMALDTNEFQPNQNPANGMRYKFGDWTDLAIRSRTIIVNVPGLAFVANFGTQYKLTFADPHGMPITAPGGDPVTDGIYFDMGTTVTIGTDVTVADTADHRWRFDGWSSGDPGGYTGAQIDPDITMSGPITQTVSWVDQYLLTIVTAYGTLSASGWYEQQSPTEFWYDTGDIAFFFVESEIFITPSLDSKALFDVWVGGMNGTAMNSPVTVTAAWYLEHLVTVVSSHGTTPPPIWVVEGESYALTIEEFLIFGGSRHYFSSWTTADTGNGGYLGTNRQVTLTVNGPITETAVWETHHLLTIITDYGTPNAIFWEEQHNQTAYWYEEGLSANFWTESEVFITTEEDAKAVFESWDGATNGSTMNSPVTVTAIWHLEYLVVVESSHGTTPPDAWVRDGQTHQISMDEVVDHPTNEDIKYKFSSWSTLDINVGGYEGTDREQVLTVTGPIKQTANWIAQYRLRITSQYEDEPGI
ncbi:MAG: hypothetical protein V3U09_08370, partial [Thermoplasmata archaeon]